MAVVNADFIDTCSYVEQVLWLFDITVMLNYSID